MLVENLVYKMALLQSLRGIIMFEKEAKRNFDELDDRGVVDDWSIEESYVNGFSNGAEFGYNKANEWHEQDVADIYDSISTDWSVKHYLCIMKDKSIVTAIGNCDEGCNGEVSVNLFFDHDDDKYYLDDIMWWKEIILPKESE